MYIYRAVATNLETTPPTIKYNMDPEKALGNNPDYSKNQDVGSIVTVSEPSVDGPPSRGFWGDFVDGFKRADLDGIDTENMTDAEVQAYLMSRAPLKRTLNSLQISLIAIGGSIGSGLFIGSGSSFATGGPAGVVIGFGVIGIMIFCTMHAVGELATRFPVQGAFAQYSTRFLDKSWGFAMGWNYILQWVVTFPLELIACAITLSYWDGDDNGATRVNKAAWVSLFYAFCVILNLFGAKGYGWGESVLSIIKVCAVIGFCIFGVVIDCGGGPHGGYIGGRYWHHPGAFADGAKGVFTVLVNAAFAFSGTELAGLAAAETANPQKSLPKAVKQVFWRVVLFYIVSLAIVGCLVPYTNPNLGAGSDGRYSPFVIAIESAGVSGLPSVFNVVICLSVLSVGNSCIYAASRTIAAMAAQGFAPRFCSYIDRQGRPLVGIAIVSIFGLLCFLAATPKYGIVFDWMLAISGLSSIFTWGSINLCHIRFRMAMKKQGRSLDELAFKAGAGIYGSILGFGINVAIIGLQFWVALWPEGVSPNANDFFQAYLSVPVVICFYIVAKIYFRDWSLFIRSSDMDLDMGTRDIDIEVVKQMNLEEQERVRSKGWLYRMYYFWC